MGGWGGGEVGKVTETQRGEEVGGWGGGQRKLVNLKIPSGGAPWTQKFRTDQSQV